MKIGKKILGLVLILATITGCSFIDKIIEINKGTSSSSSNTSGSSNPLSNETFCANAVNSNNSYVAGKNTILNLATNAGMIYNEVAKSTVVVNACYSVSGTQYNYITSGFVYEKAEQGEEDKYYILTNSSGIFHRYYNRSGTITVENINVIKVGDFEITFDDGRRYRAALTGSYDNADVAVFEINTGDDIAVPTIGSSDELEVGDSLLAIGTPSLGDSLINSLVRGTISGIERRQQVTYDEVINGINRSFQVADYTAFQFDAPVNGGMEGGPVINAAGEIVGMLSYKFQGSATSIEYESLSMALPIDNAKNVIAKIIASGEYIRPTIGVSIADVGAMTVEQRSSNGINEAVYVGSYIASVSANSSAAKAGMKGGEVIVAYNDVKVNGMSSISSQLVRQNAGDTIVLKTVDAQNVKHTYTLTL